MIRTSMICTSMIRTSMIRTSLLAMLLLGASAFAADRSGEYVGTYTSGASDSAGKLRIVIQKEGESAWSCKVFFSPGGDTEIATKPGTCAIEGDTITTEFDAATEGSTFHATIKGTATDAKSFEGTYTTASAGGEAGDEGKWKASLKE